jgi:S1-C subfamily serine protease
VLDKPYIGLGRHPMSDVRFDAEQDIDASTRHAAILQDGGGYILRDLGSTNGTFVGGQRVTADVALKDGDVIKCGVHGPEVSFRVLRDDQEEVVMPALTAGARDAVRGAREKPLAATPGSAPRETRPREPHAARGAPAAPAAPPPPSKTSVLRAEIASQRSRFRAITAFLLIVLVGSGSVLIWTNAESERKRHAAEAKLDSISVDLARLAAAKRETDSTLTALRVRLAAETDPARRTALQSEMSAVVVRRGNIDSIIAMATAEGDDELDLNMIRRSNSRAVALIYVQFSDSEIVTGTGFVVRGEGLLFTNRHVVRDRGREAERVAVQLSGSRDVLRARVERVSPDADVALVRITDSGPFPVVAGVNTSELPAAGNPVALLGFPGGGGEGDIKTATLVTGNVIETVTDSLLRLDAYGGVGASGSPVLDRSGRVVGIMFGGEGSGGSSRTIHALPIRRAMALLQL